MALCALCGAVNIANMVCSVRGMRDIGNIPSTADATKVVGPQTCLSLSVCLFFQVHATVVGGFSFCCA